MNNVHGGYGIITARLTFSIAVTIDNTLPLTIELKSFLLFANKANFCHSLHSFLVYYTESEHTCQLLQCFDNQRFFSHLPELF